MLCRKRRAVVDIARRLVIRQLCRPYSKELPRRLDEVLRNTNNGDTLTVHGFVQSVRKQKKVAFVALSDGSSIEPLQVVLKPDIAEGYFVTINFHRTYAKCLLGFRRE